MSLDRDFKQCKAEFQQIEKLLQALEKASVLENSFPYLERWRNQYFHQLSITQQDLVLRMTIIEEELAARADS